MELEAGHVGLMPSLTLRAASECHGYISIYINVGFNDLVKSINTFLFIYLLNYYFINAPFK
jgi:hypothetical protein